MSYTEDEYNRAKSRMLSEFNRAITESKELRTATEEVSGDDSAAVQPPGEKKPVDAVADRAVVSKAAVGAERESVVAADDDVRDCR